jgi:hypothetical protein
VVWWEVGEEGEAAEEEEEKPGCTPCARTRRYLHKKRVGLCSRQMGYGLVCFVSLIYGLKLDIDAANVADSRGAFTDGNLAVAAVSPGLASLGGSVDGVIGLAEGVAAEVQAAWATTIVNGLLIDALCWVSVCVSLLT